MFEERTSIVNPNVAEIAASELGVDVTELTKVITMKLTETSVDSLWSPVNTAGAIVNRDSIAKSLYAEFFDRLVDAINMKIAPSDYLILIQNHPYVQLLYWIFMVLRTYQAIH
ncbi:unnamed protein product [Heterobilharzia americana]|nr:unnamed protein product [Heterobilharzia americana]